MQNGQVDKIERSAMVLSLNRVYSRSGLFVVLAMPTSLKIHTKLISTTPPRLTYVKYAPRKIISVVLVISSLAHIRQLKRNATLETVSVGTTVPSLGFKYRIERRSCDLCERQPPELCIPQCAHPNPAAEKDWGMVYPPPQLINISDANLRAAIEAALDNGSHVRRKP